MKKIKLMIIISSLLCLNGCFLKSEDINQTTFPIAIMISKKDKLYNIHMLIINNSLTSSINLESQIDFSLYQTLIFQGKTISEASEKVSTGTNGNINTSKIKSIILHSSLFDGTSSFYKDTSSYILNNPKYRNTIYIYYSDDNPDDILNINSLNPTTNTISYLNDPSAHHVNDFLIPDTLVNTSKAYIDNFRMFYLPSLSVTSQYLKQENESKLQDVNTYNIEGGLFLTLDQSFKYFDKSSIKGLRWKEMKEDWDIELGDEEHLLNLKIKDSNWKTSISNGEIYLDITVYSKINYNNTDLQISEIEDKLQNYIYNEILDTYINTYEYVDIYHFHDLSYRKKETITSYDSFNLNITTSIENTIHES